MCYGIQISSKFKFIVVPAYEGAVAFPSFSKKEDAQKLVDEWNGKGK